METKCDANNFQPMEEIGSIFPHKIL